MELNSLLTAKLDLVISAQLVVLAKLGRFFTSVKERKRRRRRNLKVVGSAKPDKIQFLLY